MSYEDTVDAYRAMRAIEALERKQRLAIRQTEIAEIRKLGYSVKEFNGGLHLKVRWLEVWPSSGRWNNPVKKRRGHLDDGESLLGLVKREVGDSGRVLAAKAVGR